MLNANHWFVAFDQGQDLRLSAWNARTRLRAGAKHLCGQTCLHKLVDDFLAQALNIRRSPSGSGVTNDEPLARSRAPQTDSSLAAEAAHVAKSSPKLSAAYTDQFEDFESSARLLQSPVSAPRPSRFEAWKREREREFRAAEKRSTITTRRSIA